MAAAGQGQRRRAADAAVDAALDALACPRCGSRMLPAGDALRCARGHRFEAVDGIFDLWPPGRPLPLVDVFSGPYGLAYDWVIKERWLARIAGRLGWGADVDAMFRLMDHGVRCQPGQVVVDVPVGGGPTLRAAPGRLRGGLIGVDLSFAMLQRAATVVREEGLERVVLARGDATRLPLAAASVDRVLCFNGLHVLPDKLEALREFHRVLKPGGEAWGSVVVLSPTLRWARPWVNGAPFFHPADTDALAATAREAGFREWKTQRTGSLLMFRAVRGGERPVPGPARGGRRRTRATPGRATP